MNTVDWNKRYIDADTPWDSGVPSVWLREFLEEGLVKPCCVLELGCGTGTNAIFLAERGFEVTAVDLSDEALLRARKKSEDKGLSITFHQADVTTSLDLGRQFPFVFDRGTYHSVRNLNLKGFQQTLERAVSPGGYYFVLVGNANETAPPELGPPRVTAAELCAELEFDTFDLVRLEETIFHGVRIGGSEYTPLAWKVLLRRRETSR